MPVRRIASTSRAEVLFQEAKRGHNWYLEVKVKVPQKTFAILVKARAQFESKAKEYNNKTRGDQIFFPVLDTDASVLIDHLWVSSMVDLEVKGK